MLLFSALKSITTTLIQPFVYVAEVITKAIIVVVSKVIPKRTRIHEMNLVVFTEHIQSESNSTSENISTSHSDIESIFNITECKSHYSPTSFSFRFLPSYKIKPGTMDIETGFFEVIEEDEEVKEKFKPKSKSQVPVIREEPKVVVLEPKPISIRSISPPHSPPPSSPPSFPLPPLSTTATVSHPIQSRYQQQRKARLDTSKEMIKTCARNIRIRRARAKRQSILFGNDQTPGLISPEDLPQQTKNINNDDTSFPLTQVTGPNIFAQSEAAQKRILRARAFRHKALFGIDIEIPDSDSDYFGSGASSSGSSSDSGSSFGSGSDDISNSEESISLDILTPAPSIDSAFEYGPELEVQGQQHSQSQVITTTTEDLNNDNGSSEDDNFSDGDFSFLTAESTESEAYTSYYTTPTRIPTRRARVIVSGNYGGGSINYSHRISRNSDEMDIILDQMKKVYEGTKDLTAVHALEESSIGF